MIWKFKNSNKLKISKVAVTVNSATFESGKVLWTLCAGEFCTRLIAGQLNEIELGLGLYSSVTILSTHTCEITFIFENPN